MADHVASVKQAGVKTSPKTGGILRYFGEAISELKKVVWLSRQEILYLTGLVILVSVAVGLILGLLDFGFAALIDKVILGR